MADATAPSITVFSTEGCPHCARAKAWITEAGLTYTEISLSDYPERREDMLRLTNQLTVPQVFIGDTHHGDATATCNTPHHTLEQKVAAAGPPTDKRLLAPTTPPKPQPKPQERKDLGVAVDGGEVVTYAAFLRGFCIASPTVFGKGTASTKAVHSSVAQTLKAEGHPNDTDAVKKVVKSLQERKFLVEKKGELQLVGQTALEKKGVLNHWRKWDGEVTDAPEITVRGLKKAVGAAVDKYRQNGDVDYVALGESVEMFAVLESLSVLRTVKLTSGDLKRENARKAFLINLYNTLVPVAFAVCGIPESSLNRLSFFDDIFIDIGGVPLSFNQIESGLLRGNRKAPYHFGTPLSGDEEKSLKGAVIAADPRLHCALNCGAKSCPPVKFFSEVSLEAELDVVAKAFCSSTAGGEVKKGKLYVSQIFEWYIIDFGDDKKGIVSFIRKHALPGSDVHTFLEKNKGAVSLGYSDYDWSTDASKSKEYKRHRRASKL